VLSDILGDEDHLGDMDFKVAGTAEGITALQMDVKNKGISKNLMKTAVAQAREGQLHILNIMNKAIDVPRAELGEHVPRITTIKIHPDKIREVIGKGGATIKGITERHGVTIDISDDGTVKICAVGRQAAEDVKAEIKTITADVEIGQIYDRAEVIKVMDFGAFVSLLPGKDGFLHISQIKAERIEDLHEELEAGDILRVKVTEIDRQGRVKVSMRDLDTDHSG